MATDSVRRFAEEGELVLGGGTAILLQVADPVVAAGVARHSDFSHRPMHRLRATLTFVYAVMLGTPEEARRVAGFVDRAHAPVVGATDASRQLWVAATLYQTAVLVHERLHGPVSESTADEVYAAYAALGTFLQVPDGAWPADRHAFSRYWTSTLDRLEVGADARLVAHDLFHPSGGPLWLRAGLPLAALLTASLLPAGLRTAYGIQWSKSRSRRAKAAWVLAKVLVGIAPHRLRSWPSRHYLGLLRAGSKASNRA